MDVNQLKTLSWVTNLTKILVSPFTNGDKILKTHLKGLRSQMSNSEELCKQLLSPDNESAQYELSYRRKRMDKIKKVPWNALPFPNCSK